VKIQETISGCAISVLGLILFSFSCLATPQPHLEQSEGRVWVRDLDSEILYFFSRYNHSSDDWKSVFPIAVGKTATVAIDGDYEVFSNSVSFTPRYPFVAGVDYCAKFYQAALSKNYNEVYLPTTPCDMLQLDFRILPGHAVLPVVTAVFPASDVLPENLLKFHITFSASMTRGEVYRRVKLFNGRNQVIEKAFLIVDEELWDDAMKSVTLLFDPGRIKRGLRANREMGPPLTAGEAYTLVIDNGWPDQFGNRTTDVFRKHFKCISADRKKPDVSQWTITPPASKNSALVIDLNESLDFDLLADAVHVMDSKGNIVDGKASIFNRESRLIFENLEPWANGDYTVEINPTLEDLAGNNLNRLFDEDNTLGATTPVKTFLKFTLSFSEN
jgi:hypothetical protein